MTSKRFISTGAVAVLALVGCGAEDASDYPNGDIELIVAFPAGGPADTGARLLANELEDVLGQSVTVVNYEGAGGWVGWNELAAADPDGYTIGYISSPNFAAGYMNPDMDLDSGIDSFTPLANHITDPSVIAVHPDDDRFDDISDLIEHGQVNSLTGTGNGAASDDHLAILKMNAAFDTNFETVQYDGSAESKAALLGRHVDVGFVNVGDIHGEERSGELKILAILDDERSDIIPDVPTLKEAGWENLQNASSRSVMGPDDLPEEVIEVLDEALESAMNNESHLDEVLEMGLSIDYRDQDGLLELLQNDESAIDEYRSIIGWD
ncbi:Bug family tripartite tricarboxylate transporter substrate binding protein [Nesterenkonia muleiensis]|uniref:Bug family tripartite tricarboxylate transporter substrate binding protein n=1 Tax=Nesterenkonia muleiensis TaxID=2282648 RepID=UPI000E756D9B|nr:tripartite tricarboxylate transporter substrate binding protein [Nesterenkonia muleiensis]